MIAIVLLALTVADLAALAYPAYFRYGPALVASNLAEKPDKYIPLTNPDSYVLQAIKDPGNPLFIGSFQNTQFDELFQTYGTENVEFNGNYYEIQTLYADAFAYMTFFWLLIIGWAYSQFQSSIHACENNHILPHLNNSHSTPLSHTSLILL